MTAHIFWYVDTFDSLKKDSVEPPAMPPYLISCWAASSSTLLMLTSICSLVRKAAKLAVYEAVTMRAKNHQKLAISRVGAALRKNGEDYEMIYILIKIC